ncbi:MAG: hypothetical protein U9O87_02875 [Verrucomicrobiota bacterium]|nr:hypothetical protein [Verrucomicrobiota bacterium]
MKENKNIIIAILVAVIVLGIGYKAFVPNREAQRAAIDRALSYDDGISDKRYQEAGFWGTLFGDNEARRKYVVRLRQIPLDGCPVDFVKAYNAHIVAWEANDSEAISRTWDKVIYTAYDYGIAEK